MPFPEISPGITCKYLGAGGECRLLTILASMAEDVVVPDKTAHHEGHRSGSTERTCRAALNIKQQKSCSEYVVVSTK